jgi:N-acetylglucosaminyldiphosphoundecaprenol N-acetyl-beta-D-mannosaminyltransferase
VSRTARQEPGHALPGLLVAGAIAASFRPLTYEEDAAVIEGINAAAADLVWVRLSTPKQERWMAARVGRLPEPVLPGVGAAFGIIRHRPSVMVADW